MKPAGEDARVPEPSPAPFQTGTPLVVDLIMMMVNEDVMRTIIDLPAGQLKALTLAIADALAA